MFVYVVIASEDRQKIGISRDPASRLAALRTGHYEDLRLAFATETPNAAWAESLIHGHLTPWRVRGEWFEMTVEQAIEIVRQGVSASLGWGFKPFAEGETVLCHRTGIEHSDWGPHPNLGEIYTVARAFSDGPSVELCEHLGIAWSAYHFRRLVPSETIDLTRFFQ